MLMQIHMSRKCLQTYMFEGKGDILYCLLLESLQVTIIVTKLISFKFPPCIYLMFAKTEPERIYNPTIAMEFLAMFTFQLDNAKR